jgi:hypothetical protein
LPSVKVADDGTVATPTALTNPANWGNELRLTDRSFDLEKSLFQGDGDSIPGHCLAVATGTSGSGADSCNRSRARTRS